MTGISLHLCQVRVRDSRNSVTSSCAHWLKFVEILNTANMTQHSLPCRDLVSYLLRTPHAFKVLFPQFIPLSLTRIAGLSSSSLRCFKMPRFQNNYSVLWFLARLSPSCKFSCRLQAWSLTKQHSFRLHGLTWCQLVWYLRTQSGRSKTMMAYVRRRHFRKLVIHSTCYAGRLRLDGNIFSFVILDLELMVLY